MDSSSVNNDPTAAGEDCILASLERPSNYRLYYISIRCQGDATDRAYVSAVYYGDTSDRGTPGYRRGGPLPVHLSSFRPERTETGVVIVKWSTESELSNAGFTLLRSETREGEFQVINPTLITGAGTTSERQSYDFTDTTAKPNVVYYYRIKDVSLDRVRRTLTTVRLKGEMSASGKLTTTWGHLKTQN